MAADKDDSFMSNPWPCYPVKKPPRAEDLPYDDGVPLESELHVSQMTLLKDSLQLAWADRDDYYIGCNMFVYYSELQSKQNDFRGPDVFVVRNPLKKEAMRLSWVIWEEGGRAPDLVIEITSPSTEAVDRGEKKNIYGRIMRVAEYYLYDPFEKRLEGFRLNIGTGEYEPMVPDARGRYRSNVMGLWLGVEPGCYLGRQEHWLRWIDDEGHALLSGGERALMAQAEAQEAKVKAQQAKTEAQEAKVKAQQAETEAQEARSRLLQAGKALIAAGKPPSEVASLLGLSAEELK